MQFNTEQERLMELAKKTSDSTLLTALGEAMNGGELGISPPSSDETNKIGEKKLQEIKTKFKDVLCSEEFIQKIETLDSTDNKKAVLAIVDVLMGYCGLPPAIYASVLIIRGSLRSWCEVN